MIKSLFQWLLWTKWGVKKVVRLSWIQQLHMVLPDYFWALRCKQSESHNTCKVALEDSGGDSTSTGDCSFSVLLQMPVPIWTYTNIGLTKLMIHFWVKPHWISFLYSCSSGVLFFFLVSVAPVLKKETIQNSKLNKSAKNPPAL